MIIAVTPRETSVKITQFYGDYFGMSAVLRLEKGVQWKARKSGRYWILTRKGNATSLRLTPTALNHLFEVVDDG